MKAIAEAAAREKKILKKSNISAGWMRRFMERQPKLTLCKGDATAKVLVLSSTPCLQDKRITTSYGCRAKFV